MAEDSPRETPPALGAALPRLLRVSLAPSAAADALAGVALGAAALGSTPSFTAATAVGVPQVLASLLVYHGGMALNDVADAKHDAATRPERPIPSGALSVGQAAAIGAALVLLGPALALVNGAATALCLAAVAALATLYDFVGRGPLKGPLLLGLCRFGNLGAGILAGASLNTSPTAGGLSLVVWLAPLSYAAYVAAISCLGRLEDDPQREPGEEPRRWILTASMLLLGAPLFGLLASHSAADVGAAGPAPNRVGPLLALVMAFIAARSLARLARSAGARFERGQVMAAMGAALRRLLIYTSALALASGTALGTASAVLILCGYPVSHALRRRFPPS